MPHIDIIKKSNIKDTYRNNYILNNYDLNIDCIEEKFTGDLPIEKLDWKIGIIYGSSGTGKTTIIKEFYDACIIQNFEYDENSVIDNMNKNKKISEITKIFGLVGFNTVKSWLKPYHVLSNGEKMRVDLARALLSDNKIIVFDEYTSVVDRTVAKTMTLAISKLKEKLDKQIILVSVHDDILEYLDYDWSFNTNNYSFKKKQNISNQNYNSKLENLKHQNKNNIFGTYVKNIII